MKVLELIAGYQRNFSLYQEFAAECKQLFEELLVLNKISYLQIESRIKSLPSYLDKVYRLVSSNNKTADNFDDLLGIRLITYYIEDIQLVSDLIETKFRIHSRNSEYTTRNRAPNQFGYSSIHYKLSLSPSSLNSDKLAKFQHIIFEIQVRTVAQHTWATIDHKIRYKTADKIPSDIEREIFQLSALFELADSQFLAIKNKLHARAEKELLKYKQGDLTAKINSLTLEYFLQTHQTIIQKLINAANKIGFNETIIQNDPNSILYLLKLFQRLGINSMGELENIINQAQGTGPLIIEKISIVSG